MTDVKPQARNTRRGAKNAKKRSGAPAAARRVGAGSARDTVGAYFVPTHPSPAAQPSLRVDERWCVLDDQLERDIIETILSLSVEKDWPLSALPAAECVSACLAGSLDVGAVISADWARSRGHTVRHAPHAAAPL